MRVPALNLIDVWSFDTLYLIASFLVLSFVDHRFAETLRRWL